MALTDPLYCFAYQDDWAIIVNPKILGTLRANGDKNVFELLVDIYPMSSLKDKL